MDEQTFLKVLQDAAVDKVGSLDFDDTLALVDKKIAQLGLSVRLGMADETDLATLKFLLVMRIVLQETPGIKQMADSIIKTYQQKKT